MNYLPFQVFSGFHDTMEFAGTAIFTKAIGANKTFEIIVVL